MNTSEFMKRYGETMSALRAGCMALREGKIGADGLVCSVEVNGYADLEAFASENSAFFVEDLASVLEEMPRRLDMEDFRLTLHVTNKNEEGKVTWTGDAEYTACWNLAFCDTREHLFAPGEEFTICDGFIVFDKVKLSNFVPRAQKAVVGAVAVDDSNPIPALALAALANRSTKAKRYLDEHGIRTVGDIRRLQPGQVAATKSFGQGTETEVMKFRDSCLNGAAFDIPLPKPADSASLAEYVRAVIRLTLPTMDERETEVLRRYIGVLNVDKCDTLEEVGKSLGLTRERVRQLAEPLHEALFGTVTREAWNPFKEAVLGLLKTCGGCVRAEQLAQGLDAMYGWTGTTACSVVQVMRGLGVEIEPPFMGDDSGLLAIPNDGTFKTRFGCFLNIVSQTDGFRAALAYDAVCAGCAEFEIEEFSQSEYEYFCRMADRLENQETKSGFRPAWQQGLDLILGRNDTNLTELRRTIIRRIVSDRRSPCRTLAEIEERCKLLEPALSWEGYLFRSAYDRMVDVIQQNSNGEYELV